MAKMQAKIQVWQAKINLNCQTENKMAGEIYWTGVLSFSSPLNCAPLSNIPLCESIITDEKNIT